MSARTRNRSRKFRTVRRRVPCKVPRGYITEREACKRTGLPREVLERISNRPRDGDHSSGLHLARNPADQAIRRKVLLNFWSQRADVPIWGCSPEGMLPIEFGRDIKKLLDNIEQHEISVVGDFDDPDVQRLSAVDVYLYYVATETLEEVFDAFIRDIRSGYPSEDEIAAEEDRFYGDTRTEIERI